MTEIPPRLIQKGYSKLEEVLGARMKDKVKARSNKSIHIGLLFNGAVFTLLRS